MIPSLRINGVLGVAKKHAAAPAAPGATVGQPVGFLLLITKAS